MYPTCNYWRKKFQVLRDFDQRHILLYYLENKCTQFLYKFQESSQILERATKECLESGNKEYLGALLGLKASIAGQIGSEKDASKFARESVNFDKK